MQAKVTSENLKALPCVVYLDHCRRSSSYHGIHRARRPALKEAMKTKSVSTVGTA
ncbi:hypothetical protein Mapa_008188 [Marchantia paleacea]|nr:hypothetical protein Mapa_008188 [Marchantia paleacea]